VSASDNAKATGVVLKDVLIAAAVILAGYLVWGLRSFIVPAFVGGLLAYICRPVVARLERTRIPRGVAVGLLLFMFGAVALVGVNSIRAAIPNETALLELRVRALFALNHRYRALMGLDASWNRGNGLYRLTHRDLDPLMDRATEVLALTPEEHALFVASRVRGTDPVSLRANRLREYEQANTAAFETRTRRTDRAEPATKTAGGSPSSSAPPAVAQTQAPGLGDLLSSWVISPLIFLFLLADTGSIKRGLLSAVPNRLFEPALAVLHDVDQAVGSYVRGIFLECCALGLTVVVLISIVGVPPRWAIAIGIFAGASNVVPYMGFVAALVGGLAYALLAEEVHSVIPLITTDTFAIWVVAAVALGELLKNAIYEPIVLGGTVKLHPLAIVIGVLGGATLFGPAGMLLAIPTITIVKEFIVSSARHLTAYGLI
jgi:predicted PurR-regulated permease PerM